MRLDIFASRYNLVKAGQGSALIFVLLLVAAISTVAFSAGRVFVFEARVEGSLSDASAAYYAAEAGLEQALLGVRERNGSGDRDYRLCQKTSGLVTTDSSPIETCTAQDNFVKAGQANLAKLAPGAGDYEVRAYWHGPFVGRDVTDPNGGPPDGQITDDDLASPDYPSHEGSEFYLKQDQPYTLNVQNIFEGELELEFYFKWVKQGGGQGTPYPRVVELKVVPPGSVNPVGRCLIVESRSVKQGECPAESKRTDSSTTPPTPIWQSRSLINSAMSNLILAGPVVQPPPKIEQLTFTPFNGDIVFGFQPVEKTAARQPAGEVDLGRMTVESIGRVGKSQRKLQALLDRQTGTLLGTFNYSVLSKDAL